MLPNLKIVICGVVFGPLLFAVTGAGIWLPESNTRVGEMPEISRPMMQRVIADEPAQFHLMTLARRSEELERLRAQVALEVAAAFAPTQQEPELVKPAVIENPISDDVPATDMAAPTSQPPGAARVVSGAGPDSLEIRQTDVAPDDADPMQVTALLPTSANSDQTERAPRLLNVPLPPLRPGASRSGIHRQVLRRKNRITQVPPAVNTLDQDLFRSF